MGEKWQLDCQSINTHDLQCLEEIGVKSLTNLMNTILETERMPEDWRESTLVPIYKRKGDIQEGELKMQGEKVPRVTEFRYLGSTVQADGDSEIEVAKRIAAGWNSWRKVSGVLCDRKVPLSVERQAAQVGGQAGNVVQHGDTGVVTQRMGKKLEVAEMRMLRFECAITRLDKVKNEEVRSKLKVGQLGVKMREGRLRWFGHVVRREKRYVGRRVMAMEVGKRKRERLKRRWKDCIREDLKAAKLEEVDVQDRRKWKRCICTGDPT